MTEAHEHAVMKKGIGGVGMQAHAEERVRAELAAVNDLDAQSSVRWLLHAVLATQPTSVYVPGACIT